MPKGGLIIFRDLTLDYSKKFINAIPKKRIASTIVEINRTFSAPRFVRYTFPSPPPPKIPPRLAPLF